MLKYDLDKNNCNNGFVIQFSRSGLILPGKYKYYKALKTDILLCKYLLTHFKNNRYETLALACMAACC